MPLLNITDPITALLGDWASNLNVFSIALRIVLSLMLSAVVGWERSSKRHSAGLRTFMAISLAATTAMIVDIYSMSALGVTLPVVSAATVIGSAMISGNSVLFSSRNQIRGLTTSAGLFGTAIIGLACGAGLFTLALIAFVGMVFSLSVFPSLERYLKDRSNHFEIHLELKSKSNLQDFVTTIRRLGLTIDDIESNPAYANSGLAVYTISVTIHSAELKKYKKHSEIISALATLDYVYHIEEMR